MRGTTVSAAEDILGFVIDETWRPVIPTGREKALTEDFPGYLREAIFGWLQSQIKVSSGYAYSTKFVEFQNASRMDLGFRADTLLDWTDQILPHLRNINDAQFTGTAPAFVDSGS